MSIFAETYSLWPETRENYVNWHRNDFFTELTREATGRGPNTGAAGDIVVAASNFQANSTVQQVQNTVDGVSLHAQRINGVQVSIQTPTNGQVLTFDSATNQYVPTTPSTGTSKTVLGGVGNLTIPTSPTFFSIDAQVTDTTEVVTEFVLPLGGTLKNWYMLYTSPASPYTLTLRLNGADTTLVLLAGVFAGANIVRDIAHTVTVAAQDVISVRVPAVAVNSLIVYSMSIELDPT